MYKPSEPDAASDGGVPPADILPVVLIVASVLAMLWAVWKQVR